MVENVSPTLCTHLILGLVVVIFAASSTVVTVSQSLLDVSHADPAAPTLYIIQPRVHIPNSVPNFEGPESSGTRKMLRNFGHIPTCSDFF